MQHAENSKMKSLILENDNASMLLGVLCFFLLDLLFYWTVLVNFQLDGFHPEIFSTGRVTEDLLEDQLVEDEGADLAGSPRRWRGRRGAKAGYNGSLW